MKKNNWNLRKGWAIALMAGIGLMSRAFAGNADDELARQFPYTIQVEKGATEFAADDQITITSLRGDRPHLEKGGSYLVAGAYKLASADSADLSLFCTTRGESGPTPVQAAQHMEVAKGAGNFQLREALNDDGWLHVSFYVNGHSHGGIYFGEQGLENTVLRKKGWSDFAVETPPAPAGGETPVNLEANQALMAYLGSPVAPPSDMDARYTKENLAKAFTAMSEKAGWQITQLAVDDSEFPFLVYGMLAGKHTLEVAQFDASGGYPYGGSVRGSTGEGSTHFAVNMVPQSQIPNGVAQACHRRLMLRLQMLADRAQQ